MHLWAILTYEESLPGVKSCCAMPCGTSSLDTLMTVLVYMCVNSALFKLQDNTALGFKLGFCWSVAQTLSGITR